MSEATTVSGLANTEIERMSENGLGVYWRIGKFGTVRVSGSHFLCLRCKVAHSCAHIDRLKDHLSEEAAK